MHKRTISALRTFIFHKPGVWPEISLVNHSCVPNTQPVLIGDRLLLRAASDIPEGGELTISYLGAEVRHSWASVARVDGCLLRSV